MPNEFRELPTNVENLQQMVRDLQQRNQELIEEFQQRTAIELQHTMELERLYHQLTGDAPPTDWSLRDYAIAIYQYLDNIIALAPGYIYWLDKNNVYLGCNNAEAKIANLASRQMIVGKTNADLPWKEQAKILDDANKKVLESGKSLVLEEEGDVAFGYRHYMSEKVPLRDGKGEIIGILGTSFDITEQKRAMKALQYAKQKVEMENRKYIEKIKNDLYPSLMQSLHAIPVLLQTENLGNNAEKLQSIYEVIEQVLVSFDTLTQSEQLDLKLQETGDEEKVSEISFADPNVLVYQLEQKNRELQKAHNKLQQEIEKIRAVQQRETVEFAALYQQMTGQIPQAHLSLRDFALAIYEYLENILAIAPGSIFWVDRNNVCLGCNDVQAQIAGFSSRKEMIGKSSWDLPWKEQAAILEATNNKVMETGQTMTVEEAVDTPEGHRIFLSVKVPTRNKKGEVIGLMGTSLDITAQKEVMQELAEATEKAEEASRAKSEFIKNMSHDLKTPLMTVMGMAEVLAESEPTEERKNYLMMIHRAGQRMLEIFNNILDVASLEAGQEEIKQEPMDIREIIQGLYELYHPLALQKDLFFNIEINSEVPQTVMSDPMRVQRILLNLIGNALKFTKEGGVTVKAEVENHAKNTCLLVSITDTGIGIPADKLEIIFENFVRLTSAYESRYTGTGLGLGIVKRFMEDLGGTINVESTEGKGTSFICKFFC